MIKWCWICGVFILVNAIMDERNYRFVIDDVNISNIDPEVFLRFDCQLEQINNRSYYGSTRIFKYDVDDFWVHTELAFWKLNNQKLQIFDLKFDACNFLSNIQKNRLLIKFLKNIKAHSNTELKCPFQAVSTFCVYVFIKFGNYFRRTLVILWRNCSLMKRIFPQMYLWENSEA